MTVQSIIERWLLRTWEQPRSYRSSSLSGDGGLQGRMCTRRCRCGFPCICVTPALRTKSTALRMEQNEFNSQPCPSPPATDRAVSGAGSFPGGHNQGRALGGLPPGVGTEAADWGTGRTLSYQQKALASRAIFIFVKDTASKTD